MFIGEEDPIPAIAGAPRHMLVRLATAVGALIIASGTAMPAYSGDLYYSDRYERPYRYSDTYDGPYRYGKDYDQPPRFYRPRLHCNGCDCGWRCGTPAHYRRPYFAHRYPFPESVVERRYIEREYVERRYHGPAPPYYGPRPYADDFEDVPRPPVPIPSLPTSYTSYYYNDP